VQPTRGSAVPKFGDWDSNPASADGYTHIFKKVREEKQGQAGKPAGYGAHGNAGGKQHDDGGYVSSVRMHGLVLVCSCPCIACAFGSLSHLMISPSL
jgi:hypothetical protein